MARSSLKPKAKAKPPARTPPGRNMARDLARVKKLIAKAKLSGVEEGLSHGSVSLKAYGKFLTRVREPGVLVLMCAVEEKEFLMQMNPDVYFETDHYKNWPAVLIRLPKISDDELTHRLAIAWRMRAPKKLLAQLGGEKPDLSSPALRGGGGGAQRRRRG